MISLVKGDCMRIYFCLPPDFLSTLLRCCIPWQRALILFPFSAYRLVFQATATAYPASSSEWRMNEEKVQCRAAIQCDLKQMEYCAPRVFRCLLFQLMHHFFYRQPCFTSTHTILSAWLMYHSNLNFLFSENKLLETCFCCCFSFFTHHSISHEIKTVIWMTQKYTLLSYYNNDFTPSKKK